MSYAKIYKEFLANNSSTVKFEPHFQGQKIENGVYVLGNVAGLSRDPENLLHEMGHFCELELDRLLERPNYSWGLSMGRYWSMSTHMGFHWGYEQSTDQQVQREARVWAYQISLHSHFGLNEDVENLVSSATYLPAWCYYQPFATSCHDDKKKIAALVEHVKELTETFTYEKFCQEWELRNKELNEQYKKYQSESPIEFKNRMALL